MARVEFDKVSKVFGDGTRAVDSLDLEIADGEFMVLVGPSGCGKTTALRMVAGLEEITGGSVRIGDQVVNDLSPKSRDIAMVFQSYALYPHLTVRDNVAFPLKMKRMPSDEIRRRVQKAARILDLEPLLGRKPRALSGGQRQRVAMGRAIVREPAVFLMDEPLSNLDAKLRVQMRADIKRIQAKLGVTTIYVTHDQVEAMTMGHRVAVMRKGQLQQVAPPQELYDRPVNLFVGGFIGSPAMNMLEARIERTNGCLTAVLGETRLALDDEALSRRPAFTRTRAARSCSGSGRRISTTRRSRTATRSRAFKAGSRCARRSGRRCSCTSQLPRRRRSPRMSANSRRMSVTTVPSASSPRDDVRTRPRSWVGSVPGRGWSRVSPPTSSSTSGHCTSSTRRPGRRSQASAMWSDRSARECERRARAATVAWSRSAK